MALKSVADPQVSEKHQIKLKIKYFQGVYLNSSVVRTFVLSLCGGLQRGTFYIPLSSWFSQASSHFSTVTEEITSAAEEVEELICQLSS